MGDNGPYAIRAHRGQEWKADESLRSLLLHIARPSYEDPTAVVDREVDHCNSLYLLHDATGTVSSFVLAAWSDAPLGETAAPWVYVGLTVSSESSKGSGAFARLYRRILEDATDGGRREPRLWLTTASPSIYHATSSLWPRVEPRSDGTYSAHGAATARAIAKRFYPQVAASVHPFVLKRAARATVYSERESERIRALVLRHKFSLLTDLNIEESLGDRLLVITAPVHSYPRPPTED